MNQPTNPAWQGAVQVARARLHTIDEALTKLEAAVPNVDTSPPPPSPQQAVNTPPSTTPQSNQSQMAAEIQHAKGPRPLPTSSLQALKNFVSGAR